MGSVYRVAAGAMACGRTDQRWAMEKAAR